MTNERLFDVSVKELNPYWVDPQKPLLMPNEPLQFEAHKLQILLEKLDLHLEHNPAQFNSTTYMKILDRFTKLCEAIKAGAKTSADIPNEAEVDPGGNAGAASPVGEGVAPSVGYGVSTDNPAAG